MGLPSPVPNFVAQSELGMEQFSHQLWSLQLNSCLRWMDLPHNRWAYVAMQEHMSINWESPYWKYICEIKHKIALPYLYSKQVIKIHLDKYFMDELNNDICKANIPSIKPIQYLSRPTYVCEDPIVSIFAGVKFNYCPQFQCQGIDRKRRCLFCTGDQMPPLSSEFHVVWVCTKVNKIRSLVGISHFINICTLHGISLEDSFYLYMKGIDIDGNNIPVQKCLERAYNLKCIRDAWISLL